MTSVPEAVAGAHRNEWAAVLAATVRVARDLDLAEECVQEAYEAALRDWVRDRVPARPGAWLTTAAEHDALDAVRRARTPRSKLHLLVEPADGSNTGADTGADTGAADDPLRLVFLCCHPALSAEAQIALALRLVCGVRTPDVAAAFLVSEPTMAARLTREEEEEEEEDHRRRDPVPDARAGPAPGPAGLGAHRAAPAVHDGPPSRPCTRRRRTGRRSSSCTTPCSGSGRHPSSRSTRAVAVAMVDGPAATLAEVEALERDGRLAGYRCLPAVKADLLHRLGRDAGAAYEEAMTLAHNEAERAFLAERRGAEGSPGSS